jgi:hypothetical protein
MQSVSLSALEQLGMLMDANVDGSITLEEMLETMKDIMAARKRPN